VSEYPFLRGTWRSPKPPRAGLCGRSHDGDRFEGPKSLRRSSRISLGGLQLAGETVQRSRPSVLCLGVPQTTELFRSL
jgi:hypothetical protein